MAALFTAYHLKVQGDRVADRVGLDGAVDEPAQLRRADLRADAAGGDAAAHGAATATSHPLFLKQSTDRDEALRAAEDLLLTHSHVKRGDMIVLTIGEPMGKSGGTNTMKIVRVGEHRA